jgi:hypothetical protein
VTVPAADPNLAISEAVASKPLAVDEDGNVLIHMIRPCVGRGKGRHVYEAAMLEANATKFSGWRMYVNHQTQAERKAKAGLPRDVEQMGGRVLESYWDPSVPADGRFGQGAVVGKVRPVPRVRDLIDNDPDLLEASINATATSVRPVTKDGQRAWLVEGIEDKGTVDWVSESGAGGKVVSTLLEAAYGTRDEEEAAMLDDLSDEELAEHLAATRPGVVAVLEEADDPVLVARVAAAKARDAATSARNTANKNNPGKGAMKGRKPRVKPPFTALQHAAEDTADGGADDDLEALVAKLMKKGLPRNLAEKAAKRQLGAKKAQEGDYEEDDVDVTEQLEEALASETFAERIRGLVEGAVADSVEDAVARALTEAQTRIRAEARVDADRTIEVRDMRDHAKAMIEAAKLPPQFAAESIAKFSLVEGQPTEALDLFEAYDEESGTVTKTVIEVLEEAVNEEIDRQRALVGSLRPTRVRGQGASTPADGGENAGGEGKGKLTEGGPDRVGARTHTLLQEAGFVDPDKCYAGLQ